MPGGALRELKRIARGLFRMADHVAVRTRAALGCDHVATGLGRLLLRATRPEGAARPDELRFHEVRGLDEYRRYLESMGGAREKRLALEKLLSFDQVPFSYVGYDACAGCETEFLVDFEWGATREHDGRLLPNYRERVVSKATGLNSRQRAAALSMEHLLGALPLRAASIYVTEAVTPFFRYVRERAPRTIGSEYLGADLPPGITRSGVRHEDVTALSLPDASFDLAVSNDVLEHVPDYRRAFRELLRVLKPGGALLFTVPFHVDRYENVIRARVTERGIEHLLPPEYHGDPVRADAGVLCFQTFGWHLLDELRELGYADAGTLFVWSYVHGILGGDVAVFFARKGA
jgi:SAM-dependent methyltransferase